ncbi:LAFE_0D11914g1_1 [Lachancea fermentati]|uniref:LAFE_0D11914g1_1 n=1 Tax=Lachancea fermentati TaxID=4955 RepID=A0A1G4MBX1_LACFM|nr:LAFE_0D11914g1_1 [Lachancea fermentati]
MIKRGYASQPLQALLAKTLGGNVLARQLDQTSVSSLTKNTATLTDLWLRDAIYHKTRNTSTSLSSETESGKENHSVVLSLKVIIRTLQKLRFVADDNLYFILLNKIQSVPIKWVSRTGTFITDDKPVELYHELGHMLNSKASRTEDRADLLCLAKFTLGLLTDYSNVVKKRQKIIPNIEFMKTCIDIIIRTGSVTYLQEALQVVDDDALIHYSMVSFYHKTGESLQLRAYLDEHVLISKCIYPELFSPLLMRCIFDFIALDLEEEACRILKFSLHNNMRISSGDLSRLNCLCQKSGMMKLRLLLARDKKYGDADYRVSWKTFQKELCFSDYIKLFEESNVNFFDELHDMDFLQNKLPTEHMNLDGWRSFIEFTKPTPQAPDSLRAFYLNMLLTHITSFRYLGLVTLLWKYLLVDLQMVSDFLNTPRLKEKSNNAGFHILFNSIGKSSAAKLTGYELFAFLKNDYPGLRSNAYPSFDFTESDYCSLIKSTFWGSDHHAAYFYLFQYFADMGHQLITVDDTNTPEWKLPQKLQYIVDIEMAEKYGDQEIKGLVELIRQWYLDNFDSHDQATKIPEDLLRELFGPLYVHNINVGTLASLDRQFSSPSKDFSPNGDYFLVADTENLERLKTTLESIKIQMLE